jgi:hypothetical protein
MLYLLTVNFCYICRDTGIFKNLQISSKKAGYGYFFQAINDLSQGFLYNYLHNYTHLRLPSRCPLIHCIIV